MQKVGVKMDALKNICLGFATLSILASLFLLGSKLPDIVWLIVLYMFIGVIVLGFLWFVGFLVKAMLEAD